jgi:hypothetical protein
MTDRKTIAGINNGNAAVERADILFNSAIHSFVHGKAVKNMLPESRQADTPGLAQSTGNKLSLVFEVPLPASFDSSYHWYRGFSSGAQNNNNDNNNNNRCRCVRNRIKYLDCPDDKKGCVRAVLFKN